jgi:hypothetical protein
VTTSTLRASRAEDASAVEPSAEQRRAGFLFEIMSTRAGRSGISPRRSRSNAEYVQALKRANQAPASHPRGTTIFHDGTPKDTHGW